MEWINSRVDATIEKNGLTVETKPIPAIPTIPEDYENPRGLPEAWLKRYLSLDRAQLALDVIKAFDKNYQVERENGRLRTMVWIMSLVVSPLIGEVVKVLFRLLFANWIHLGFS